MLSIDTSYKYRRMVSIQTDVQARQLGSSQGEFPCFLAAARSASFCSMRECRSTSSTMLLMPMASQSSCISLPSSVSKVLALFECVSWCVRFLKLFQFLV